MNYLKYNEYLDSNYLSSDFYTDEEMEMLKDYYQRENVEIEIKSDELPFWNVTIWDILTQIIKTN